MSQPRVFITLGRTGQVVERVGTESNSRELRHDIGPRSGSKRSIGDALRTNPDGSLVSRKRQREDCTYSGACENGVNEMGLTADDLRLKLMHRRSKQNGLDKLRKADHLHGELVKSAQPSASNSIFQLMPQAKESFHLRKMSYTQNAGQINQVGSMQKLNSSCIAHDVGVRPPDTLLRTTRGILPPTNYDGLQQFPSIRATDVSTTKVFMRNGIYDASRSTGFAPTTFKSTTENAKPVTQLAAMNGISQVGWIPLTVSGLLHSLGLEKYEIAFRAEEVDMTALKQMGDKDLKDLGIPMGPRKKILAHMLRSKQQPPQVRNLNLALDR
ncbi:ankyrin repeat and SAM domain-containing protein 6-like [Senna tora]|uniref:Ankyrin repeat and SAM domain-containing protein 6-like n=1 Tax=Senna tora TaxID=362788 RepID=A0A834WJY5_9FABA|nr:ankyrin repeat and SAM domain-containing protein 6-like [Senna tora]